MSTTLGISARRGNSSSSTTYKHLIPCLRLSVDSFQANTRAKGNRRAMVHASDEKSVGESDVLEIGCPEEQRILCSRTAQVIMAGGFNNNTKVVSLGKSYTSLEGGEHLPLSSGKNIKPEHVGPLWH